MIVRSRVSSTYSFHTSASANSVAIGAQQIGPVKLLGELLLRRPCAPRLLPLGRFSSVCICSV